MNTIRPDLEALPSQLQKLPVDERGYPVPWFVAWQNGKPEFRAMDTDKLRRAIVHKVCWVCGEQLGRPMTFVVGPMCGINRVSAEPPSHLECGEWSARNCPFLNNSKRPRREDEVINVQNLQDQSAGIAIARNPGVTLLWTTRDYRTFRSGGILFKIGEPESIQFYSEGRKATRAEVDASVAAGLPHLQKLADLDGIEAQYDLANMRKAFTKLLDTYLTP